MRVLESLARRLEEVALQSVVAALKLDPPKLDDLAPRCLTVNCNLKVLWSVTCPAVACWGNSLATQEAGSCRFYPPRVVQNQMGFLSLKDEKKT